MSRTKLTPFAYAAPHKQPSQPQLPPPTNLHTVRHIQCRLSPATLEEGESVEVKTKSALSTTGKLPYMAFQLQ